MVQLQKIFYLGILLYYFIFFVEELGNVNDLDSYGIIKGELNTLEFID